MLACSKSATSDLGDGTPCRSASILHVSALEVSEHVSNMLHSRQIF